jgi:antitoxin (DNA-binding transcriptional repressor) of toxin-antitoxin stability system
MKTVRVSVLKARLSSYLALVRRGETIEVLSRETAVARLSPVPPAGDPLSIRRPAPGARRPGQIPIAPPLKVSQDVLTILLEERQPER